MARRAPREDGDTDAPGHEPERMCAVTRARLAPADLIRFVRAPDGTITPDLGCRLPGRGVWVGLDRAVVETAARQNVFARSLKRPVIVPEGLASQVEDLLRRRVVSALAMANKAGLVVSGFAKVDALIAAGKAAALAHAAEAAADGSDKLDRKLRAVAAAARDETARARHRKDTGDAQEAPPGDAGDRPAESGPAIVTDLFSLDLSLALGRENVVHAALSHGGATQYFLNEAGRFRRYRLSSHGAEGRPPRMSSSTEQV